MTGQRFLALVTFGVWSAATTPLAPWAAPGTPGADQLASAPAALAQRLHQSALAVLQAMIRPALAPGHRLAKVGDEGLLPGFPPVSLAASPGCALPDSLPARWPGSGGRAGKAGANMQAVGA